MKRLLILAALLILTACAAVTESPTPTASPSPTATTTVTPSPTVTPSITPSPTITLTSPPTDTPIPTLTPEFFNPNPGGDLLFIPYEDEDCQLPCWQGLRVGESDLGDVQETFLRVFNLTISPDSLKSVPGKPVTWLDVEGTKVAWFGWELPGFIYIDMKIVVDLETDILQGIHIAHSSTDDSVINPYSAEQVLETLGTPSSIYMSPWESHHMDWYTVYEDGLVSVHNIAQDFYEETVGGKRITKAQFCLSESVSHASYFIVPPFDLESGDLEQVHKAWFLSAITVRDTTDNLLGLSAEEITTMAKETYNPCFTIEKPD